MEDIKEIELAKSWFELAKILATIAGFLVVTSGIFSGDAHNFFNLAVQQTNDLIKTAYSTNCSNFPYSSGLIKSASGLAIQADILFMGFLIGAIIMAVLSLSFWMIGRTKLKRAIGKKG